VQFPRAALSDRGRARLALISTRLRIGPHTILYARHDPARYIYNIVDGMVRSYRERPDGRRQVLGFLFGGDLCGLASRGRYVNTGETLTPVTVFRIPLEQLAALAAGDASVSWGLLCKVTQTLREAQRHTLLLSRSYAPGRMAMFLHMMEQTYPSPRGRIVVPIGLADLAEFVELPPETIARTLVELERRGVVAREDRRAYRVKNRRVFETLVAGGHL
jgi:CRP-like cAMP-binding protein